MEATSVSIDRLMNKEDVVHIYNGILLSHEKWNNAICSNIDRPRDYHTKWSQTNINIWYHLYVKSENMTQMNLFTKQKQTHGLIEQTRGYRRKVGTGIN